jgi:uncharacterized protein (DUF4415 family)
MPKLKAGTVIPTVAEDKRIKEGIALDDSNPAWTKADFAKAKKASEFFDKKTYAGLVELEKRGRGKRGPQKAPTKVMASVRFDTDVLDRLRGLGRGWSTVVNEKMREWLETGSTTFVVAKKAAKRTAVTPSLTGKKVTMGKYVLGSGKSVASKPVARVRSASKTKLKTLER